MARRGGSTATRLLARSPPGRGISVALQKRRGSALQKWTTRRTRSLTPRSPQLPSSTTRSRSAPAAVDQARARSPLPGGSSVARRGRSTATRLLARSPPRRGISVALQKRPGSALEEWTTRRTRSLTPRSAQLPSSTTRSRSVPAAVDRARARSPLPGGSSVARRGGSTATRLPPRSPPKRWSAHPFRSGGPWREPGRDDDQSVSRIGVARATPGPHARRPPGAASDGSFLEIAEGRGRLSWNVRIVTGLSWSRACGPRAHAAVVEHEHAGKGDDESMKSVAEPRGQPRRL